MTTIETRDGRPVAFEHAVEMAEYLCALDFGLDLIAGEERATPQSVADLFCTCFLHWETDYRQQQGFTEASDLSSDAVVCGMIVSYAVYISQTVTVLPGFAAHV